MDELFHKHIALMLTEEEAEELLQCIAASEFEAKVSELTPVVRVKIEQALECYHSKQKEPHE